MRRVLLDENLPRPLAGVLSGLEIVTVQDAGWAGTKNGELLALAAERFDVFLTGDKNLRFQQNLTRFSIGIVLAAGRSTRLDDLLPMVPKLREAIDAVAPGKLVEVQPE